MNVAKSFLTVWTAPVDGESQVLEGKKGGYAVTRNQAKEKKLSFFKNIAKPSYRLY